MNKEFISRKDILNQLKGMPENVDVRVYNINKEGITETYILRKNACYNSEGEKIGLSYTAKLITDHFYTPIIADQIETSEYYD